MHTPQIEQGLRLWQRLGSRCLPGRRGRQRLRWRLPVPPALKVPAGQGVQAKSTVVLQAPGIKQYPASQAKQHSWQLVLAACGTVEGVANIIDYHAVTVIEKRVSGRDCGAGGTGGAGVMGGGAGLEDLKARAD